MYLLILRQNQPLIHALMLSQVAHFSFTFAPGNKFKRIG